MGLGANRGGGRYAGGIVNEPSHEEPYLFEEEEPEDLRGQWEETIQREKEYNEQQPGN